MIKDLTDQILPLVHFNVSSNGLTISADRLNAERFIAFDVIGRCKDCRSETVEIDFVVTPQGVTILCNRFKTQKFIQFDNIYDLPQHCFMRLRSRGKTFNIPYATTHFNLPDEHKRQLANVQGQQSDKAKSSKTRKPNNPTKPTELTAEEELDNLFKQIN